MGEELTVTHLSGRRSRPLLLTTSYCPQICFPVLLYSYKASHLLQTKPQVGFQVHHFIDFKPFDYLHYSSTAARCLRVASISSLYSQAIPSMTPFPPTKVRTTAKKPSFSQPWWIYPAARISLNSSPIQRTFGNAKKTWSHFNVSAKSCSKPRCCTPWSTGMKMSTGDEAPYQSAYCQTAAEKAQRGIIVLRIVGRSRVTLSSRSWRVVLGKTFPDRPACKIQIQSGNSSHKYAAAWRYSGVGAKYAMIKVA